MDARGAREGTPRLGERLDGGARVDRVAVDDDREGCTRRSGSDENRVRLGRAGFVELMGLGGAREEVAQAVVAGLESSPDELDCRADGAHSAAEGAGSSS